MTGPCIGVFDSGVGGLTVAARVMNDLPQTRVLYYGDTAHCPYGNRSADEVCGFIESIVDYLVGQGAQAVLMACNTSSALALERVQAWCPVPVLGIIDPAARAAAVRTRNGRIGLIANPLTARSGAYERALIPSVVPMRPAGEDLTGPRLFPVGCPRLVPLVEAGEVASDAAREALLEYLAPLVQAGVDTLIMGCTHYPFLRPLLSELLGPGVELVDPAHFVVEELTRLGLELRHASRPEHRFEVSGNPLDFEKTGTRLLGCRLSGVRQVELASHRVCQAAS